MRRQLLKRVVFQSAEKLPIHVSMVWNWWATMSELVNQMDNGVMIYLIVDVSIVNINNDQQNTIQKS
jgi:hypothetical protein